MDKQAISNSCQGLYYLCFQMLTCICSSFWAFLTPYFLAIDHLAGLPTSPAWGHGSRYSEKKIQSHIQLVEVPTPLSRVKRSDDRKYVTCICTLPSPWDRNFRGGIKRFYKLITTFRNLN